MKVAVRTPGVVTLLAPDFDLRLNEQGELAEWAVAKPVDLTSTHKVNITLERLHEMAATYDPVNIEAAAINFDHADEGPAEGWVESLAVRDGMLWVKPIRLSAEVVQGVRESRYQRASIEFTTNHPETGGWYFNGLAVLGAAKSAIKGLPPLRLSAPRYVLDLSESETAQPIADAPVEETSMSNPNAEAPVTPGLTDEEHGFLRRLMAKVLGNEKVEAKLAEQPAPEAVAITAANVQEMVNAGIQAGLAEQSVDFDLRSLAGKATPSAIAKARPVLLRAKKEGRSEDYEATLAMLSEQDASALLGGPIASAEQAGSTVTGVACSQEDVAFFESVGIKADRVAAIEKKYDLRPYIARTRRQAE